MSHIPYCFQKYPFFIFIFNVILHEKEAPEFCDWWARFFPFSLKAGQAALQTQPSCLSLLSTGVTVCITSTSSKPISLHFLLTRVAPERIEKPLLLEHTLHRLMSNHHSTHGRLGDCGSAHGLLRVVLFPGPVRLPRSTALLGEGSSGPPCSSGTRAHHGYELWDRMFVLVCFVFILSHLNFPKNFSLWPLTC